MNNFYIDELILLFIIWFYYEHVRSTFICYLSLNYLTIGFIYLCMMKYENRNCIVLSFSLWSCALISSFLLYLVLYNEWFDLWNKNKEIQQIPICLLIKSFLHYLFLNYHKNKIDDRKEDDEWIERKEIIMFIRIHYDVKCENTIFICI